MRSGGFPGQKEALKAAMRERLRRQRRRWLAGAVGAFLAGVAGAGGLTFWKAADEPAAELPGELTWAYRLATGELDRLLARSTAFLAVADEHPRDPVLAQGLLRLGLHCLSSGPSRDHDLVYRLLGTLRAARRSPEIQRLIPLLEQRPR